MFMHKETLHCGAHGLCRYTTVSGLAPIPIQTTTATIWVLLYYPCYYQLTDCSLARTSMYFSS